jgi:hypothetical protein
MTIAAIGLLLLGALIAIGNLGGSLAASLRKRRGESGGYSSIPLLSLIFCGLAWLIARDELGLWVMFPIALDPANWSLVILPFYLLMRREAGRGPED